MRIIVMSLAALLAGGSTAAQTNAPPVLTSHGFVRGVVENDLTVYRGIPFAAPPVGDLRWRPPQPAEKWEGVREATRFAPDPYQGNGSGNVSENCLYLNLI
jgi:para-nitrobenzyl esterase